MDLTILMKASWVSRPYVDAPVLPGAGELVGAADPVRELLELVLAHLDLLVEVDFVAGDADACVSRAYRHARARGRG
jgi:hypothetical protein